MFPCVRINDEEDEGEGEGDTVLWMDKGRQRRRNYDNSETVHDRM